VAELQKLGGARVILTMASSAKAISDVVGGLGIDDNLLIPAAPNDPLTIGVFPLLMGRRQISGWYAGTARDSQDTLEFSALSDVHPMIEKFPFSLVTDAYEQMHSGKARFRAVLIMESRGQTIRRSELTLFLESLRLGYPRESDADVSSGCARRLRKKSLLPCRLFCCEGEPCSGTTFVHSSTRRFRRLPCFILRFVSEP
jgi:hypothetical protein